MRIRYQGLGNDGKVTQGVLDAESLPLALELLRRQGVVPFLAEPASDVSGRTFWHFDINTKRASLGLRAQFVRQCATLMSAGIPLDRTLGLLQSQAPKGRHKDLLSQVRESVTSGQSLSMALSAGGTGFQPDEIGLVRAGEQTGSLVPVLEDLGRALEQRLELQGKIVSTLIYPAFLLALAPLSLAIIAIVLVPSLEPLFEGSRAEMPLVLHLLSGVSRELRERAPLWLAAALVFCLTVALILRKDAARHALQRLALKLPIARTIAQHTEAARICSTLAALLKGGASLQTAMSAVAEIAITADGRRQITAARDAVVSGRRLAEAMTTIKSLKPDTIQMIAIGEETNRLDALLGHIAKTEQKAGERYIERLMTIATPLLTILVGAMVGGVVMSIMSAILSLNDMAVR